MNEDLREKMGNCIWRLFLKSWLKSENVDVKMLFKEKSYLDEFYSKARSGDNKAQLVMFYVCMGEIDTFKKCNAMDWLIDAAKGGLKEAQYLLGEFKLIGFRLDINESEADMLIQKAADNGLLEAQRRAAEIAGDAGFIDRETRFNKMAALQGDPETLVKMAEELADEYDEDENYEGAFKQYRLVLKQSGNLDCLNRARFKLATYHAHGLGCVKSLEDAVSFYKSVVFSEQIVHGNSWDYFDNPRNYEYRLKSLLILMILANQIECYEYIKDDEFNNLLIIFEKNNFQSFFVGFSIAQTNEIRDALNRYFDELNMEAMLPGCARSIGVAQTLLLNNIVRYKEISEANKELTLSEEELKQKNIELSELNCSLEEANRQIIKIEAEKRKTLEGFMAMFAHKFRGSLDSITYNMEHDGDVSLYQEAVVIMRGMVDVFSLLSTDPERLKQMLREDSSGEGSLKEVARHTLAIVIQQLLSKAGRDKIRQHYHAYAAREHIVPIDTSRIEWLEQHLDIERTLQQQWECEWSNQLKNSASLEQLQQWISDHIAPFNIKGFDRNIHFQPNGITDSLVTIVLNELLVNVFKYYNSAERSSICVELESESTFQLLRISNPSTRTERSQFKGSGKGHDYLVGVTERIEGCFKRPKPQDHFIVEFRFPSWALAEEN